MDCTENLYVDDATLFLMGKDPMQHVYDMQSQFRIARNVYRKHFLDCNMKANKTEFLAVFRGPRPILVSSRLTVDLSSRLLVSTDPFSDAALTCIDTVFITTTYKHMGARANSGCNMMPEVVNRPSSMFGQSRLLSPKVLRDNNLSTASRLCYVRSLL